MEDRAKPLLKAAAWRLRIIAVLVSLPVMFIDFHDDATVVSVHARYSMQFEPYLDKVLTGNWVRYESAGRIRGLFMTYRHGDTDIPIEG